ncbi:MAG: hypothetical protein OXH46_10805 [Gemmatimonadetes bacterium]|nr:hypothetical protein [Gemmatimonadota bacterium]MCZ0934405.1 hypothetical protein [Candidatus Palauibacter rhopaloidicola]
MSKLRVATPLLAILPLLAACGGRITVQVTADEAAAEPVNDLEVQFIPFDRDSLFAVIVGQAATPEPAIPEDLEEASRTEQEYRDRWSTAESSWNNVRDSMRSITTQLDNLDDRSVEYRRLFDQFGDLEDREQALNRQRQAAFDEFSELQQANQQRVDSICIVIDSWEEAAFAGYGDMEDDLLMALGQQVMADTTDADGVAWASASGGPWWIHARVSTAAGELYWNVMVDEASGDTLRLVPGNAELRQGVRQRC